MLVNFVSYFIVVYDTA